MKRYPYSSIKASHFDQTIGAFDFETKGLGGSLLYASWYVEGEAEPHGIAGEPQIIVDTLLAVFERYGHSVQWFAHNAQYDWRYILDELLERYSNSIQFLMRSESDIFSIQTETFKLWDSFALWPHSLKALAQQFAPEFAKLDIDDIANWNPNNPEHVAYALRDSEALVKGLRGYFNSIEMLFEIGPGGTVAATAMKAWSHTIDSDTKYWPTSSNNEAICREAYAGGLVGLSTIKTKYNVKTYDRNSSYPAVMLSQPVPEGTAVRTDKIIPDYLGVYQVNVTAPDNLVWPILHTRNARGSLLWPRGTFNTTITSIELDFALAHGYKLNSVYGGLIWEDKVYPFDDFVNKCMSARKTYKGKAYEQTVKLIQNSLYGKFGMRHERCELFVPSNDDETLGAIPWGDYETVNGKSLWVRTVDDNDIRSKVEWAAFITAGARLALLDIIYRIGPKHVIYCDTDSITCDVEFPPEFIDPIEYGQWKLEKSWSEFRAIAPKVYVGRYDKDSVNGTKAGTYYGACKGIRKPNYRQLFADGFIES